MTGDRAVSRLDLLAADLAGEVLTVATRDGVEAAGTTGIDSSTPRDHVIFGRTGVGVEASTALIDSTGRDRGVDHACDACGRGRAVAARQANAISKDEEAQAELERAVLEEAKNQALAVDCTWNVGHA